MAGPDAFFLTTDRGRRFCILHAPGDGVPVRGAMVYVHPFAEEMNKARRMAAVQARALAAAGVAVLQVDLCGCGDSEGEFHDADWDGWVGDALDAARWLRARTGRLPALWGLRVGALVASDAAARLEWPADLLLWQPVIQGRPALQQFLRLKLTRQIVAPRAGERMGTREVRAQLASQGVLELAGYALSEALAQGLESAELRIPPARVAWLDVAPAAPAALAPASRARIDAWRIVGRTVDARAVEGLPFWQTQEIAECAGLVDATLDVVRAWHS